MSPSTLDPAQARLIVQARLGREPQDMLEAAVVLEAWSGVPAQRALDAGRALMPAVAMAPQPSVGRVPMARPQQGVLLQETAFVATVMAIAIWAGPLVSSLGAAVVQRGLAVALPLALALQWTLGARYLDHPHGLGHLARRRWALLAAGAGVVAVPSALLGLSGTLAGLLAVTWTGGAILIRRRCPAAYAVAVLGATEAMAVGVDALAALAACTAVVVLSLTVALRPSTAAARPSPGGWLRPLAAGLTGTGVGIVLVLDPAMDWARGTVPALALLPSTLAGCWAGHHLRHLERALPAALSGVAVMGARSSAPARRVLRVLLGALARLVLLCAALSSALLALAPASIAGGAAVLAGFLAVALATLLLSLLLALGRAPWAVLSVGCAVVAEVAVRLSSDGAAAGTGVLVGGAVATALALPAVVALLRRPERTLATAVWIP